MIEYQEYQVEKNQKKNLSGKGIYILRQITSSWLDYPDNCSLAVVVFFTGCLHSCKGCQNEELQQFGDNIDTEYLSYEDAIKKIEHECLRNRTDKVVLSGGDPLFFYNQEFVQYLLDKNILDVCIYTGSDIDKVKEIGIHGFKYIKCGTYKEEEKQESMKNTEKMKLASSNQNFYNSNYEKISENGILFFNKTD